MTMDSSAIEGFTVKTEGPGNPPEEPYPKASVFNYLPLNRRYSHTVSRISQSNIRNGTGSCITL